MPTSAPLSNAIRTIFLSKAILSNQSIHNVGIRNAFCLKIDRFVMPILRWIHAAVWFNTEYIDWLKSSASAKSFCSTFGYGPSQHTILEWNSGYAPIFFFIVLLPPSQRLDVFVSNYKHIPNQLYHHPNVLCITHSSHQQRSSSTRTLKRKYMVYSHEWYFTISSNIIITITIIVRHVSHKANP